MLAIYIDAITAIVMDSTPFYGHLRPGATFGVDVDAIVRHVAESSVGDDWVYRRYNRITSTMAYSTECILNNSMVNIELRVIPYG